MPSLNSKLERFENDDDRTDYLFELMEETKKRVDAVLLFGPCNNELADKTSNIYHYRKQVKMTGTFFNISYREEERRVLPAVISNSLYNQAIKSHGLDVTDIFAFLKYAYQYGTGTCEFFAIVGAYFLATEFDLDLSIETIYSNESHTYIRLHTNPEFIMDFWSPMVCKYDDTISWNEFFGERYLRNEHSTFKTNLKLTSTQLIIMGSQVFTEENSRERLRIMNRVNELVALETLKPESEQNSLSIIRV